MHSISILPIIIPFTIAKLGMWHQPGPGKRILFLNIPSSTTTSLAGGYNIWVLKGKLSKNDVNTLKNTRYKFKSKIKG